MLLFTHPTITAISIMISCCTLHHHFLIASLCFCNLSRLIFGFGTKYFGAQHLFLCLLMSLLDSYLGQMGARILISNSFDHTILAEGIF